MSEYKVVLPIMCSECLHITTFDIQARVARGATYDCKCGRVMLIQDDLSTVDLQEKMVADAEEHGVEIRGSVFYSVELA